MSPELGQLVSTELEYDGGREVTVYIPPARRPDAIVFAGDGQLIAAWGRTLEGSECPSTMIVGLHRAGDETDRLHEYSPPLSPDRFAAHERFFTQALRQWVKERFDVALPAARTGVIGVSASGELSLALGLRHPELFGVVMSASPGGGYRPPARLPSQLPRTYLVAGKSEPFFLENAHRWARALRGAGGEVVMEERAGSHGDPFWREEFPRMIGWAFGTKLAAGATAGPEPVDR